jgi:hypothetical protein
VVKIGEEEITRRTIIKLTLCHVMFPIFTSRCVIEAGGIPTVIAILQKHLTERDRSWAEQEARSTTYDAHDGTATISVCELNNLHRKQVTYIYDGQPLPIEWAMHLLVAMIGDGKSVNSLLRCCLCFNFLCSSVLMFVVINNSEYCTSIS